MRQYWFHQGQQLLTIPVHSPSVLRARGWHKIARGVVESQIPGGRRWLREAKAGELYALKDGALLPCLGILTMMPVVPHDERAISGRAHSHLWAYRYGDEFTATVTCPDCGQESAHTFVRPGRDHVSCPHCRHWVRVEVRKPA